MLVLRLNHYYFIIIIIFVYKYVKVSGPEVMQGNLSRGRHKMYIYICIYIYICVCVHGKSFINVKSALRAFCRSRLLPRMSAPRERTVRYANVYRIKNERVVHAEFLISMSIYELFKNRFLPFLAPLLDLKNAVEVDELKKKHEKMR